MHNEIKDFNEESLLEILEEERRRISMELHDNVQNKLILLRDKYSKNNKELFDEIQDILKELRNVTQQLIPKSLQELSLVEYLNIYETSLNQIYNGKFKTDFRTNVSEKRKVPKNIEVNLFNIIREAVSNVIKYAETTPTLLIRYIESEQQLCLIIQDFGDGFDVKEVTEKETFGLKSIKTRCEKMNATYDIKSRKLYGTKIEILIPINEVNEEYEMGISQGDISSKVALESQTILLVDNQIEYINELKKIIKENYPNAKIIYALTIKEAIEKTKNKDYDIDTIITDITMPDMSGIQFIEYLQKEGIDKKCKIIVYSINDNPAYIFKLAQKMKIQYYVWKEAAFDEGKHPIIKALEEKEAYYTSEIKQVNNSFKLKKFDERKDRLYREMFEKYISLLKENKSKKEMIEEIQKEYKHMEQGSISKYIQRYKNNSLGIFDEEQITHILLKLSREYAL